MARKRTEPVYPAPTIENILDSDWHRNGSGSESGFVVATFNDPKHGGRMVMIDFGPLPINDGEQEQETHDEQKDFVAVFQLEKLAEGNIRMFSRYDENDEFIPGTGGNAWRGGNFAHTYRPLIQAFRKRQEKLDDERRERTNQKNLAKRAAENEAL